MSSSKMIVLKSSDGETFEVEEAVFLESQTIKHMIEDNCADKIIPLLHVSSQILVKVIEYCRRHVESSDEDLKAFDADFVNVDLDTIFELIKAAKYLNIGSLHDLTTLAAVETIAKQVKDPAELLKFLNLKKIFPEKKEEVRKENA